MQSNLRNIKTSEPKKSKLANYSWILLSIGSIIGLISLIAPAGSFHYENLLSWDMWMFGYNISYDWSVGTEIFWTSNPILLTFSLVTFVSVIIANLLGLIGAIELRRQNYYTYRTAGRSSIILIGLTLFYLIAYELHFVISTGVSFWSFLYPSFAVYGQFIGAALMIVTFFIAKNALRYTVPLLEELQQGMQSVLKVNDVWKSYEDLEVLKGISFEVAEKEVKVIFGPSGSGKSTLLRCINMLSPPDKGEIYLRGQNLTNPDIDINALRSRIGMVFQHFNLFSHLKAIDNVSIGLRRVKGMTKEEAYEKALFALKSVKMDAWANHYPAELSGGQQQRVGIARALAMEPDVILFDEPTSALDPELIGEVLQVMQDIANSGTTMIVVTHEMGFARAVASEMIFLDEGVIIERGTPDHFFTSPESDRVKKFLNQLEVLYGSHEKLLKSKNSEGLE